MKLRVLAHSINGARATGMILGGLAGLVLAAGTLAVSSSAALTAAVLAFWLFGWLLGPIYTGGGESIRPEHFALVPLRPARLALGLLGTAFVGVAPLVSLVAFVAITVHAAGLGVAAFLVSLPAVALQVVLVVVLSSLAIRTRTSAILAALVNAFMNVVLNQSWVLIWAAVEFDLLDHSLPPTLTTIAYALPSGWGLAAVEAADSGNWILAAGAILGLAALIAAALLAWARLLVRRTTTKPAHRPADGTTLDRLSAHSDVGAVAAKELRTWSRDLMRTHLHYFALFFGVLYCLAPLIIGWYGLLRWAGPIMVIMAAATSANLFALDGAALWLTLVNPGAERAEVRGRQAAWLIRVAPVAIVLTVAGTIVGGESWTWSWSLAILAATLGGGAGLIAVISVYNLIPVPEPARRTGNPLEAGNIFGQVLGVLLLATLTALPTAGVAWLGDQLDNPPLQWAAVIVGVASGILYTFWFGRLAHNRLRVTGPALLATMRNSNSTTTRKTAKPKLPPAKSALVTTLWIACWIPLFPQGLVPLYMIVNDSPQKLWFLALHLSPPYQIPTTIVMTAIGLTMLYFGTVIPRRYEGLNRSELLAE
ncbi:hypothetical protein Acor_35810 [Acrocarpospora corrugata]|uniref:ABC-2 type transport system permease protein n=1 Tax=Acrocarpospora corrugata TaxID=35763 RepID=A0A5M3VXD2_9ACTN|nr:hypothetical protein [Acrocarpospora corrugata]GES01517.1 hypothetical protein Acor_35810 [Acrocarpospora corrugata]